MRKLLLLIPAVATLYFCISHSLAKRELTRGALMDTQIAYCLETIEGLSFNCNGYEWPSGYREACRKLGVELVWMDAPNEETEGRYTLGWTDGQVITMNIPPCTERSLETFFHEVGHVLLRHATKSARISMSLEKREGEAIYFSEQILQAISNTKTAQR